MNNEEIEVIAVDQIFSFRLMIQLLALVITEEVDSIRCGECVAWQGEY
jgi:hypothetical protein